MIYVIVVLALVFAIIAFVAVRRPLPEAGTREAGERRAWRLGGILVGAALIVLCVVQLIQSYAS
ncbi:hypothetical protein OD997_01385 [Microbacterium sp. CGR1]